MHKPPGFMTTRRDVRGRKTVFDLLPEDLPWLAPIGRLDLESEGLLLFTNDPHLGWALSDPSRGVQKTYVVTCKGTVSDASVQQLRDGVSLAGQDAPTRPAQVTVRERSERTTTLEIVLHEGKKRQIRRMLLAVGSRVRRLVRTQIGPFDLGTLPAGQCRELSASEVSELAMAAGFHLYERRQIA
jgi:pseudouridine synthase